jgi:hypothetical protein
MLIILFRIADVYALGTSVLLCVTTRYYALESITQPQHALLRDLTTDSMLLLLLYYFYSI